MSTDRRTAVIVGILYIIGTVAGGLSMAVTRGLLDAPDYLNLLSSDPSRAQLAAFLVLVMGLPLAMVSAMMFPILKRRNEALAIGYVIFRGALETLTYIGVAVCWLLLVVVARQYADAGAAVASQWSSLGILVAKARDPILVAIQDIVFGLGALMFYYLLYQARLIPRWISGWGFIAAILYFAAGIVATFSTHVAAFSGVDLVIILLPLALQEMVMAVWLIAKGFSPPGGSGVHSRQPRGL